MATFVLVHGGWHGGWCWERVAPLLARDGHTVLTPDLPGHGVDRTPVSARPWERYASSIADLVVAQAPPVILVGHSSGGMVISEAARQQTDAIAGLVFLAAFMLAPGATSREAMGAADGSLLMEALAIDATSGVMTVRPELVREVFYHDCTDEDAAWAIARLQPEPLIPSVRAVDGGCETASEPAVPRFYIETTRDRALPLVVQRRMQHALPCERVFSLDTGHSPFLSAPSRLAHVLGVISAWDGPIGQ